MNVDGPTHPQEAGRCSREEPRVPPFRVEHADKLAHRLALLDRLVAEQAGGLLLLPDVQTQVEGVDTRIRTNLVERGVRY